MKTFFVFIFILFGLNAFAESESKPLELPDTSKINGQPAQGQATFEMTCKSGGRTIKSGEPGYETCVSEAQQNLSNRMNNSHQNGSATGSDFNIKFGK